MAQVHQVHRAQKRLPGPMDYSSSVRSDLPEDAQNDRIFSECYSVREWLSCPKPGATERYCSGVGIGRCPQSVRMLFTCWAAEQDSDIPRLRTR